VCIYKKLQAVKQILGFGLPVLPRGRKESINAAKCFKPKTKQEHMMQGLAYKTNPNWGKLLLTNKHQEQIIE